MGAMARPLLARSHSLLCAAHLEHLAYAALLLLAAIVLSLLGDAARPTCGATCPRTILFSEILVHASVVAVIGALAFTGAWIAGIAHRTWQERIHIEALTHGKDDPELAAIAHGSHAASPILAHARTYLWTGLVTGVPALLLFMSSMGKAETLMPLIFLFTAMAAAAAVVRGTLLLRDGRSLLERVRLDAEIPV